MWQYYEFHHASRRNITIVKIYIYIYVYWFWYCGWHLVWRSHFSESLISSHFIIFGTFTLISSLLACNNKVWSKQHLWHLLKLQRYFWLFSKKQIVNNYEDLDFLKFIMKTKTRGFVVIHRQLACIAYIYGLILYCYFQNFL